MLIRLPLQNRHPSSQTTKAFSFAGEGFCGILFYNQFYSSGRVNLTLYVIGLVCVLMVVDGVPSDTNFAITTNRCVSEAPFIRVQVERVRI